MESNTITFLVLRPRLEASLAGRLAVLVLAAVTACAQPRPHTSGGGVTDSSDGDPATEADAPDGSDRRRRPDDDAGAERDEDDPPRTGGAPGGRSGTAGARAGGGGAGGRAAGGGGGREGAAASGSGGAGGSGGAQAGTGGAAPEPPVAGAAASDGAPIVGRWFGNIVGRTLGRAFTGCVTITQVDAPGPGGMSRYVGDTTCSTRLDYVGVTDDVYRFNEMMTEGRGCPEGYLLLSVNAEQILKYEWFVGTSMTAESTGTLAKVVACP